MICYLDDSVRLCWIVLQAYPDNLTSAIRVRASLPGWGHGEFDYLRMKSGLRHHGSRLQRVIRLLGSFFLGQGALQGVSLLAGLYLVRTLSIDAYAQFGIAFGLQTTASALMDFGLASTIIPLVGEQFADRRLVGKYVRAATHLRDRIFWITSPLVTAAFLFTTYKHGWGIKIEAFLLLSVLLSLYSSGKVSCFSAPLFLHRRIQNYYAPQTLGALGRLLLYLALGCEKSLNSMGAALLNALNIAANGWLIGRASKKHFDWPDHNDPSTEKEMIRYILPAAPVIMLGAFQDRISLFLISIFGSTTSIAQVAALGRLGQISMVFMTFNIVIVEPYVARLPRARLRATYLKLLTGGILATAILSLFSFLFPSPFIWILGPKYHTLENLTGWVITTACINYVAGLMWIMNRSRKWIFWRGTILELALILLVQVGFFLIIGVRTTREAIFFNFASSFCYILTHSYIAIYGHSLKQPAETDVSGDLLSGL